VVNGQHKALQNIDAFISWSKTMSDDDYRQLVHRGQLNRVGVSKGVGCAKSALLQNPRIKALLEELEDNLRLLGVLPSQTTEASPSNSLPQISDRTLLIHTHDTKRVSELEEEAGQPHEFVFYSL
jgi:hypothetical protein